MQQATPPALSLNGTIVLGPGPWLAETTTGQGGPRRAKALLLMTGEAKHHPQIFGWGLGWDDPSVVESRAPKGRRQFNTPFLGANLDGLAWLLSFAGERCLFQNWAPQLHVIFDVAHS